MNFRPGIKQKFFENPDENIRLGNERWIELWGGLRAGPFNTHCLAETWNEHPCTTEPQPIPGIPPSPGPPPGPPPGPLPPACGAVVQQLCANETLQQCEECAKAHSAQVRPKCPAFSDVIAACKAC